MKCDQCDYEFNIYKFAYRSIRRCPECHKMYDMIFPAGTALVSIISSLVICWLITMNIQHEFIVNVAIFILVYYLFDIIFKIILICSNKYEIVEFRKQ